VPLDLGKAHPAARRGREPTIRYGNRHDLGGLHDRRWSELLGGQLGDPDADRGVIDVAESGVLEPRKEVALDVAVVARERRGSQADDAGAPLLDPRAERDLAEYWIDVGAGRLGVLNTREEELGVAPAFEVPASLAPARITVPCPPGTALVACDRAHRSSSEPVIVSRT
jgi:hypothetical protein